MLCAAASSEYSAGSDVDENPSYDGLLLIVTHAAATLDSSADTLQRAYLVLRHASPLYRW